MGEGLKLIKAQILRFKLIQIVKTIDLISNSEKNIPNLKK